MALTQVNIGFAPNDGLGDLLRNAFDKLNLNDNDLLNTITTYISNTKSGQTALLTAGNGKVINYADFGLLAFTDANYTLKLWAEDTNGISSPIIKASQTASGFVFNLTFPSIVTFLAHKNL